MVPKLFGPIRERYANRPGGYTRVLRIEPLKEDQAESAILELVDGPKDMRFALTAKTLARRPAKLGLTPALTTHVKKVTQFREGGVESLRDMVQRLRVEQSEGIDDRILPPPRKVYPEDKMKREMHYFEEVDYYKPANPVRRRSARKEQTKQHPVEDVVTEEQVATPETRKEVS
jgi:large subunit ribosomal protein L17